MDILVLALLGLCFGSFANALVWRIHMQAKSSKKEKYRKLNTYSITKGRSMCVHCRHELATKDLIPLFSWVFLQGKCRYCGKKISWQYPLVELLTSLLFVASYIFWPFDTSGLWGVASFGAWLAILVGLIALAVYDIRWMLLPNRIVLFLCWLAIIFVATRAIDLGSVDVLKDYFLGAAVGGGIFYLLFMISNEKWIGGGDVKLGFLLGTLTGTAHYALLMIFIASILGSLYSLPLMAAKKVNLATRVPFGPFLIVAAVIVVLFGEVLVDAYIDLVLGSSF